MKQVQKKLSLIQEINTRYQQEMKHLKKKKSHLQIKLLLTVVFPFLIAAIFIEVAKTFIRIKLRNTFTKPIQGKDLEAPSEPVPVKTEPVPKEIMKPQPISKKEI